VDKEDVVLILGKIDEVKDTLVDKLDQTKLEQNKINMEFYQCKGRGGMTNKIVFTILALLLTGTGINIYKVYSFHNYVNPSTENTGKDLHPEHHNQQSHNEPKKV